MRIIPPKPFTYKGGEKAVLLLHGFTGTTAHMNLLGKYLSERGYTCHAPLYKGHGLPAEKLVTTTPKEWWESAKNGYEALKLEGYEDISVIGISMGGVFALKLAMEFQVSGVVSMCAPIKKRDTTDLLNRMLNYAKVYKEFEGKTLEQIELEMKHLEEMPFESMEDFKQMILDTNENLEEITAPTFVIQGSLDDLVYRESADMIYQKIGSTHKQIKWYEQSGHVITMDKEKKQVFEDTYQFLQTF